MLFMLDRDFREKGKGFMKKYVPSLNPSNPPKQSIQSPLDRLTVSLQRRLPPTGTVVRVGEFDEEPAWWEAEVF